MSNNVALQLSIRSMVSSGYELQKLRIQMGNRIVANFRIKLGIKSSEREAELEVEEKKLMESLRISYEKITQGVTSLPTKRKFKAEGHITEYAEFFLISEYLKMEEQEELHFRQLGALVEDHPLYSEFLSTVKGIGPAISGVIISYIDIHKADTCASIWKYAGLDVAEDGKGRSRRAEHLVERKYIDREGKEQVKKGITFQPFLKTKLIGVLGSSFLRSKSPYADVYYAYKHRYDSDPRHMEKTKGHRHNMAIRVMIKRFLVDLYMFWRNMEGLTVTEEYSVRKLGLTHHRSENFENPHASAP